MESTAIDTQKETEILNKLENNKTRIKPKVINISDFDLTADEIRVLSYGPKFTPTPSTNVQELQGDVKEFCRKLRLTEYFGDNTQIDESLVRPKSGFNPGRNQNILLDTYIDFLTKYPLEPPSKHKTNISNNEWKAIHSLNSNNNLIIKEADKGGAFVVLNSDFYKQKILQTLSDTNTYKQLPSTHSDISVMNKVTKFTQKYNNRLTKKEIKYLTDFQYKSSQIYGLPKIHKSENIIGAIEKDNSEYIKTNAPIDLKFRPIIAGPQCPTHRLSELVDSILKPCLCKVKSYIKDTPAFIKHIMDNPDATECDLLVTYDVESLYTNITHQLGKQAIAYWFEICKDIIPARFSMNLIIEAVDIILKNNTFQFNKTAWIQVSGTAMGTIMAPVYSTLALGFLEEKLYAHVDENYGPAHGEYLRQQWKRFLDDCFVKWKNCICPTPAFTEILNGLNSNINFVIHADTSAIPFLDVQVYKENDRLKTDLYQKPTDTSNYVPYDSCHPRSTKANIPKTLARRIMMLCETSENQEKHFTELTKTLVEKNYPKDLITRAIEETKCLKRTDLINKKQKEKDSTIALVTSYNPNNPNVSSIVKQSLPVLNTIPNIKDRKVVFAKRQPQNLKSLLCSAKYIEETNKIFKVTKCGQKCKTCEILQEGTFVNFNKAQVTFHVKNDFTCISTNVIYVITCSCGYQYIGSTQNLRMRMNVHRQHLRDESLRILNVSKHIHCCSKGKFQVFPFYQMYTNDKSLREAKEQYFIDKYGPELNC